MRKSIIAILVFLLSNCLAQGQISVTESTGRKQSETTGKLKISGYIQTQYQSGEEGASLKIGTPNENKDESFNRIGVRRGLVKLAYEEGIASGVFQFDITEKGFNIKDVYLSIKDPWTKTSALKAGVFYRPFGYEISYSSSQRESPERSTIFTTLFPGERDLGTAFIFQPTKESLLHFLKIETGLFAGNGIKQETDSRKDFIGHLSANKKLKKIEIGGGVSYYNGSVFQGTENIYNMKDKLFILDNSDSNKGKFAKREYIGFDCQLVLKTKLGTTQLKAEYLSGEQPGTSDNSTSPNASSLPAHDTYIRHFNGGYVMYVQQLGRLPVSAVLKYDWYDPNIKISGNDIGQNNTAKGDIAYNTLGFGMFWNINTSLRLQAYYDINNNEKSENLLDYQKDIKDNVFTLRMQYKF